MSRAIASSNLAIKPGPGGALVLSGKVVEHAAKPAHCGEFIDRLFSIPKLSALELHSDAARARLRFKPGAGSTADLLHAVAAAMRSARPAHFPFADLGLVQGLAPDCPLEIWRAGNRLTFLRLKRLRPERCRFFHPAFADPFIRSAVLVELASVAYLRGEAGSRWSRGSIEVEFQPGRITVESLLEILESALLRAASSQSRRPIQPFHFRGHLVDTNLALAVVSDFLFPPAGLLSVVTLWMLNARHVRPAIRSLRALRFDLDVLYSTIACLTLLSFSFIASALMYWMFEFWPRHVKRLREAEMTKFLASLKRCPRSVWVESGGTEMEVDLNRVRLGDTVILREGDIAPGDGLVLAGDALVAENWAAGLRQTKPGDLIHCSGQVARGETRMRLDTLGHGAVTSALAGWHRQSMATPVSEHRVKEVASAAVLPALLLGILALWRGGISMAKAVVRPDYVTGPAIARELGWVASLIEAARHGVFIRTDAALEKLAQCDCFIFSPGVAWGPGPRPPGEIAAALRGLGVEEILMPSGNMDAGDTLALRQPGVNGAVRENLDSGGLINERQCLGRRVAFFGDCEAYTEASSLADVSVHVCSPPFHDNPYGEIALFEPALESVLALRTIATRYNDSLGDSFLTALVPNVACVVAAFSVGFPILGVFALTNAGTLATYLAASRALRAAGASASHPQLP